MLPAFRSCYYYGRRLVSVCHLQRPDSPNLSQAAIVKASAESPLQLEWRSNCCWAPRRLAQVHRRSAPDRTVIACDGFEYSWDGHESEGTYRARARTVVVELRKSSTVDGVMLRGLALIREVACCRCWLRFVDEVTARERWLAPSSVPADTRRVIVIETVVL